MMETLQTFGTYFWGISGIGFLGVVAIFSLIKISPIQLNPWEKLFGMIGKMANKDLLDKMEEQKGAVEDIKKATDSLADRIEQKDAEDARNHILRFGDEIKNHVRHSQEYFNQILDDISKYEKYCREHPDFKNERTAATEAIIKEVYQKCMKENDFL